MTNKATHLTSVDSPSSEPGELLAFCKASSDQLRLDVLRVLSRDSFGVLELCHIFDSRQSGMSHHLKILAKTNLVATRREGNSIFYRRAHRDTQDPLYRLQEALFKTVDAQPIPEPIQQKIQSVQAERAANSQDFFSENADKFRRQQEQIAAYELYGPSAIELLLRCIGNSKGNVLEVGPGEGAFLAELAPHFKTVYALDNSNQMLEKATQFARVSGLSNVEFMLGDTRATDLRNLDIDCAVVNMVLHHTPSPAAIFADLASIVKTGGQLFVTDLCHHDQEWARESCGDLWLGFDPEDLTQWGEGAGFKAGENIFLAQRNGFRVQIRQFIRI